MKKDNDILRQAATMLGKKGGESGDGSVKRRGGCEYYKQLRAKRKHYQNPEWLHKATSNQ